MTLSCTAVDPEGWHCILPLPHRLPHRPAAGAEFVVDTGVVYRYTCPMTTSAPAPIDRPLFTGDVTHISRAGVVLCGWAGTTIAPTDRPTGCDRCLAVAEYVDLAALSHLEPSLRDRHFATAEATRFAEEHGLDEAALESAVLDQVFPQMDPADLERALRDPSRRLRARAELARRTV